MIEVSDNGVDIAEDCFPKDLEPFGHARDVHTREHEGTGLGHYLAKSFTELPAASWTSSTASDVYSSTGTTFSAARVARGRPTILPRPSRPCWPCPGRLKFLCFQTPKRSLLRQFEHHQQGSLFGVEIIVRDKIDQNLAPWASPRLDAFEIIDGQGSLQFGHGFTLDSKVGLD